MGVGLLFLPLVITAAASAHQWMMTDSEIEFPESVGVSLSATSTKVDGLRSFTVGVDQEGRVHGRVVSIEPSDGSAVGLGQLTIRFLQNGQLIKETESDADGTFAVDGLADGAYSFVAASESAYVAHGVNVSRLSNNPMFETAALIHAMPQIRKILEGTQFVSKINESTRQTTDVIVGANRVELTNGELRGRVVSAGLSELLPTTVHLFRGEEKLTEASVDSNGKFRIQGLAPGVYEILVVGASGFAAACFETIDSAQRPDSFDGQTQVSLQDLGTPELNMVLVAPMPAAQQNEEIIYEDSGIGLLGDQAGGFYSDGGFSGGGGGGFGSIGGQSGSIVGLAAMAAGIVALAEDDGSGPPATPFGL